MDVLARCAQSHVQDGAVFRDVDFFPSEHRVDPGPQSGFLRQLQQELQSFVGDAIFRVIEVKPGGLYGETLAALCIIRRRARGDVIGGLCRGGLGVPSKLDGW